MASPAGRPGGGGPAKFKGQEHDEWALEGPLPHEHEAADDGKDKASAADGAEKRRRRVTTSKDGFICIPCAKLKASGAFLGGALSATCRRPLSRGAGVRRRSDEGPY